MLAKNSGGKFLMPDFGGGRKKSFQPYTLPYLLTDSNSGSAMDTHLQRAQQAGIFS